MNSPRNKPIEIRTIRIEEKILGANDEIADRIRERLDEAGVFMINLMSSPGAGKTTLLERTLERLNPPIRPAVIEGDVETSHDAEKLKRFGVPLAQLNAPSCYLSAGMIERAIDAIPLNEIDLLIIENIGNLICPAGPRTGENLKIMLLSATEGHEKPLKYPRMFLECSTLIINKIDLIPHTDFDLDKAKSSALSINPQLKIFEISCRVGIGVQAWVDWLGDEVRRL